MDRVNSLKPRNHPYSSTYNDADVFYSSTPVMDPSMFTRSDVPRQDDHVDITSEGLPQSWQRYEGYPPADRYIRGVEGAMPWEQNQSMDDNEVEEIPRTEGESRSKKGCRTKNFSMHEDNVLISAWLNVSTDPIVGTNQGRETCWGRMKEYYDMHKEEHMPDRPRRSLQARWQEIQKQVSKFKGYLAQIERRNRSGLTTFDKVRNKRNFLNYKCVGLNEMN